MDFLKSKEETANKYYLVRNTTISPIIKSLTTNLLTDEELAYLEEYKQSEEYLGSTPEDQTARRRMIEINKLRDFFNQIVNSNRVETPNYRIGRIYQNVRNVKQPIPEPQFFIGINKEKALSSETTQYELRNVMDTIRLSYKASDSKEELVNILVSEFGEGEIFLNHRQLFESGLSNMLKKEIHKFNPGTNSTDKITTGVLEYELITKEEYDAKSVNRNIPAKPKKAVPQEKTVDDILKENQELPSEEQAENFEVNKNNYKQVVENMKYRDLYDLAKSLDMDSSKYVKVKQDELKKNILEYYESAD